MFGEHAERWVALAPSGEVGRQPRRLLVDAVPLVVWRALFGRPVVFLDRCPHREYPLSTGHRTITGRLVCDAHAWEFDAEGRCLRTHKPVDRNQYHATAFPCRDVGGTLWVYTGPDAVGDPPDAGHFNN